MVSKKHKIMDDEGFLRSSHYDKHNNPKMSKKKSWKFAYIGAIMVILAIIVLVIITQYYSIYHPDDKVPWFISLPLIISFGGGWFLFSYIVGYNALAKK